MAVTAGLIMLGLAAQSRLRLAPAEGSGSSDSCNKLYSANQHLQTANDQASQAESAASAASYGDRSSRLAAAERSRYHAIAARAAADRATSAAYGGGTSASDAAAKARAAADRAQAAANDATYRASTS